MDEKDIRKGVALITKAIVSKETGPEYEALLSESHVMAGILLAQFLVDIHHIAQTFGKGVVDK